MILRLKNWMRTMGPYRSATSTIPRIPLLESMSGKLPTTGLGGGCGMGTLGEVMAPPRRSPIDAL